MKQEILRMSHVTLIDDGMTKLDDFNLNVYAGEIMGLLCQNAHGRDTLLRVITQNAPIHYGYIYFRETLVNNYRHSAGGRNAVAIIEPRSHLVQDLTVADNIFVLRRGFKKYFINPHTLEMQLRQFTEELHLSFHASDPVSRLSRYESCVVELLRAVVTGVKLIVVRDISTAISAMELQKFHRLMRHYARTAGIAFLYICNHHEEAFTVCERISLMRSGHILRVLDRRDFSNELLWRYSLDFTRELPPPGDATDEAEVLRLSGVCFGALQGLSLSVRHGECLALLDMDNRIFDDLITVMNSEKPPLAGEILLDGTPLAAHKTCPPVSFITEYPAKTMLFHEMSYLDNLCFAAARKSPDLWRRHTLRENVAQEYRQFVGDFVYLENIDLLHTRDLIDLVYYSVHLYNPRIVFCVQPFSGADMYLRRHIIDLIHLLQKKGIAVVLLAVNLSDCLLVADRLLLVENGRLCREYSQKDFAELADLPPH